MTNRTRQMLKEANFTELQKSILISIGWGQPTTKLNLYAVKGADPGILDDILLMLCLSGKVTPEELEKVLEESLKKGYPKMNRYRRKKNV